MRLKDFEKETLDGKHGEARRIAMAVLVDLGELFGAEKMIPVSQVHIDATLYMVDAGVEFAEHLTNRGGTVAVPTSLNPASIDLIRWKEYRVPPRLLEMSRRLEKAYLQMGAAPTWTCAPYQQGLIPRFGEQVAWGESNAIAFVNSVIGARTNRYGDLMDICAAIIGRVPGFGLHLSGNRKAEILVRLNGFGEGALENRAVYPLLGYLFGEIAGDRVGAVSGVPRNVGFDSLKAFSAAAASSGAVGLFHIAGVTPEAKTLAACLKGRKARETHEITPGMLRDVRDRLWAVRKDAADLIVTGCPHLSFAELGRLAGLMRGRRVHSGVAFWAFTSQTVYGWIESSGILKALSDSGVRVFTDGCPLQYPKESWKFGAAMTDSAKFAHYCFSQTGHEAALGTLEECVESAVHGRICRRDPEWGK